MSPEQSKSLSSKLSKMGSEKTKTTKYDSKTPEKPSQLVSSPTKKASPLDASVAMDTSLNDSVIPGTPQDDWETRKAAKTAAYKKYVSRG